MAQKAMTQVYYSQARSSTAHRYGRKDWDEAKNRSVYGDQYSADGLGHNFEVRLGLNGDVEMSGASRLAQMIDHKFLDQDVEFFKNCPSTLEMITSFLFQQASYQWGRLVLDLEVREGLDLVCQIKNGVLSLKKTVRTRGVKNVYDVEVVVSGAVDGQTGLLMQRKVLNEKIASMLQDGWVDEILLMSDFSEFNKLGELFSPLTLSAVYLRDALDDKVLRELRRP